MSVFGRNVLVIILLFACRFGFAQITSCSIIGRDTSGCAPLFISDTASEVTSSTIVERRWYLTTCTGTPVYSTPTGGLYLYFSYIISTPGCYCLRLWSKDANGDTCTVTKCNITAAIKPTINFSFTPALLEGCIPFTVHAVCNSTAGTGTINSITIDWGCGPPFTTLTSCSSTPISYTYNSCPPGYYTPTIIVSNNYNCYADTTYPQLVHIIPDPVANFTADTTVAECAHSPLTVHFTASITDPDLTYNWYVNGALEQSGSSNLFTYTFPVSPNCYNIKLVVSHPSGCADSITKGDYICVQSTPVVSFKSSDTTFCLPAKIAFTNTSPGIASLTWTLTGPQNFPAVNGATDTVNFTVAGNYVMKGVGIFATGCEDSVTLTLTAKPSPSAAFTASPTASCKSPFTVNYTCTNPCAGCSYLWKGGGGVPACCQTTQNDVITYSPTISPTSYNMTFIVTNSVGCSDTNVQTNLITYQNLSPQITASGYQGCGPECITLKDATVFPTGDPVTTECWSFPGSSTPPGCGDTIQRCFAGPRCYSVRLRVGTASGCMDSVTLVDTICAHQPPTCSLVVTPDSMCYEADTVGFTLTCDSFTFCKVNFGDGPGFQTFYTSHFTHNYQSIGNLCTTVVVYKDSCASDTLTGCVYIKAPIATFTEATACPSKDTVFLTNHSVMATSYVWKYCNGDSSILANPEPTLGYCDTCTVTLYAYNSTTNCHHHKSILVNLPCDSSSFAPYNAKICTGTGITFTNTSPGSSASFTRWVIDTIGGINWTGPGSSGGNTFTFTPTTLGVYTIAMENQTFAGCIDTVYGTLYVCNVAAFIGYDTSCFPLPICFTDSTVNACPLFGPVTWAWSFGDTTTSNQQTPCHTYAHPGTYNVSLIVSNGICSDTVTQVVPTSNVVSINFHIDTIACPGHQLCVTNNSTGIALVYNWSAPGATPSSSTSASPCFTYATPMDTFIQLHLSSNGQCSFDSTIPLHARYPVAGGYASRNYIICPNPPNPIDFTDTSKFVDSLWTWNFGDGNQTNDQNPAHIYVYPGTYIVTLTVVDKSGCVDSTVIDTIVVSGPFGHVTVNPTFGACSCKDSVHFSVATYNAVNINFTYGCGLGNYFSNISPVGTIDSPTVINLAFLYCVTDSCLPLVLVHDSLGCPVQLPTSLIVVDSPVVNFTFNSYGICQAGTVCFHDSTFYHQSPAESYTVSWLWNFGDGSTDTTENPCHYYAQPGLYFVKLYITSNVGCIDSSVTKQLIIPAYPVAAFFASDSFVCRGSPICFHDTSVIYPLTGPAYWTWDFGDGTPVDTIYTDTICHTYANSGNYRVTLCVYDSLGCSNCDSTAVMQVISNPVANPGGTVVACYGIPTPLSGSGGVTYMWLPPSLFLNPDSSNPEITVYQDTTVSLIVTDAYGCKDTASTQVEAGRVMANFNTSLTVCAQDSFCVTDGSTDNHGTVVSWWYNFGDGTIKSGPNTCHIYAQPGTYNIMLTDTDNNGCIDTVSKPLTVYSSPEAAFTLNDSAICSNNPICVTDHSTSTTPIITWNWNYGDNTNDTGVGPHCHLFSPPYSSNYNIILVVTDQHNCRDSAEASVAVSTVPTANFSWTRSCEDDSMPLINTSNAGSSPIISCVWTLWLGAPDPVIDSNCYTKFLFPPGQHSVQLIAADLNGCADTIVKQVLTDSLSQLSVSPGDTIICLGSSVNYQVTGTFTNIQWVPPVWLSNPDSSIVTINPLGDVGYEIIATNGVCPSATDTFVINVIQPVPIEAVAEPDQIILGLSSNILTTIGGQIDSIVWQPDSTLTCGNCVNPVATPRQTTTYYATIYYSYKGYTCINTAQVTITVLNTCDNSIIYVPSVFTPNGDGKNDIFMIRGSGAAKIKYFRIYDRWGRLVFDAADGLANNPQWGWNGNDMEGKKLNPAVYVYMYQIQCTNGDFVSGQGNVTLIR